MLAQKKPFNRENYKTVNMVNTPLGCYVYEHRLIAESALGHLIPKGVEVHHHSKAQLVLCESRSYHILLHNRKKALEACGHATWRHCCDCDAYKHTDEFYTKRTGICKKCSQIRSKDYYESNKDETVITRKKYAGKNKDELQEYRRNYYLKNKEKRLEYQKAYKKKNKDKINRYRELNKDKIHAYDKAYRERKKVEIC